MRFLVIGAALLYASAGHAQTTLTATPAIISAGATLTATWSGIPSPSSNNWIAMYPPGAPNNNTYIASRWTNGTASGSVAFTAPTTPGTYQLRLFSSGFTQLATSNNFTVTARSVSGTVTLNGSALAGVSFAATNGGSCTQSDAGGNYVCGVSQGWSGSISPSFGAHGFNPASRSYTNVTSNQTAQNYTALSPFELSGTVSWNGSPLAGVTMTAAGGVCTQTNASGQYSCGVPPGWSGNVTPSLANHAFSPASRSYTSVSANQTVQDYAATVLRHVSGTVRVNGSPVANVAFAASGGGSCTSSNSAGQYSCTVLDGWTGSVTPSHMGYSFSPSSRNYTSLGADDPAEDYTALASSPVSNISFIHVDHLNTPRLITNDQGQTVWRWDQQEPFGVNVAEENPSGLGAYEMPLRFPGQYFDKETNLHYNYFRDYDSGIGRYVQSDPIGLQGGINTYLYVEATPLLQIDFLGLANGPAIKQLGIPQSFGFSKTKCSYYEEKCKQSGQCVPRDEYACNAKRCCESFDDSSYSNRCTRQCLIEYDISTCTGKTGEELNNCRRLAHYICYTKCLNVVQAVRTGGGMFPPPACKAAADAIGGMW